MAFFEVTNGVAWIKFLKCLENLFLRIIYMSSTQLKSKFSTVTYRNRI